MIKFKLCVLISISITTTKLHSQVLQLFRPPYHNKISESRTGTSTFYITGTIKGVDRGSIILYGSQQSVIDTITIKDGKIEILGESRHPYPVTLKVMGDYYVYSFFVEQANLELNLDMQTHKFIVKGGNENNLRNTLNDINQPILTRLASYRGFINKAQDLVDLIMYMKFVDSFLITENQYLENIEQQVSKKLFGYYLLSSINSALISYGYFERRLSLLKNLPDSIRNSSLGQEVYSSIKNEQIKRQKLINKKAFPLQLKDKNSKLYSLNKYKGKYIILDFWASWCVPCLKELPLLRKINLSNKSNKIVFISISIDKSKDQWLKSIIKNEIPWTSLLADTKTIMKYDIGSIPNKILIGPNGRVIATYLTLDELYNKIRDIKN